MSLGVQESIFLAKFCQSTTSINGVEEERCVAMANEPFRQPAFKIIIGRNSWKPMGKIEKSAIRFKANL